MAVAVAVRPAGADVNVDAALAVAAVRASGAEGTALSVAAHGLPETVEWPECGGLVSGRPDGRRRGGRRRAPGSAGVAERARGCVRVRECAYVAARVCVCVSACARAHVRACACA